MHTVSKKSPINGSSSAELFRRLISGELTSFGFCAVEWLQKMSDKWRFMMTKCTHGHTHTFDPAVILFSQTRLDLYMLPLKILSVHHTHRHNVRQKCTLNQTTNNTVIHGTRCM